MLKTQGLYHEKPSKHLTLFSPETINIKTKIKSNQIKSKH